MGTGRTAYTLFALSGCATTQTTPAPQTDRIVVADADRTIHSHEDIPITAVTVKSKPDVVLPILRASYEELGIKVQVFLRRRGLASVRSAIAILSNHSSSVIRR